MSGAVYKSGPIELRCGRWQDALAGITPDHVISDPPYSPRQGEGFRSHNDYARKNGERSPDVSNGTITYTQGMPYAPMSQEIATAAAERFAGVKWFIAFGDHISFAWWESALSAVGRYVFAPVIWLRGNGPRFQGDGPCSAVEYICVSRLRQKTTIGSLPGYYSFQPLRGEATDERIVTGQKPVDLMRSIIRDYTEPGDVVCDPFSGGATTLLAAAMEGRRSIGAEMDPTTYAKAVRRLQAGYTPPLPLGERIAL